MLIQNDPQSKELPSSSLAIEDTARTFLREYLNLYLSKEEAEDLIAEISHLSPDEVLNLYTQDLVSMAYAVGQRAGRDELILKMRVAIEILGYAIVCTFIAELLFITNQAPVVINGLLSLFTSLSLGIKLVNGQGFRRERFEQRCMDQLRVGIRQVFLPTDLNKTTGE